MPPWRASVILGSAAWHSRISAMTFSATLPVSPSTGRAANAPVVPTPALLTSRSTGFAVSRRRCSTRASPAGSVRSAARTSISVPSSAASFSSRSPRRATSTSATPRAESCRANCSPNPEDAPVTRALA